MMISECPGSSLSASRRRSLAENPKSPDEAARTAACMLVRTWSALPSHGLGGHGSNQGIDLKRILFISQSPSLHGRHPTFGVLSHNDEGIGAKNFLIVDKPRPQIVEKVEGQQMLREAHVENVDGAQSTQIRRAGASSPTRLSRRLFAADEDCQVVQFAETWPGRGHP